MKGLSLVLLSAAVSALSGCACGVASSPPGRGSGGRDSADAIAVRGRSELRDEALDDVQAAVRSKLSMRGLQGAALERARAQAIEAYRTVYRRHPEECDLAAEAAFRVGELLRAGGDFEAAVAEFERACSLARRSDFGARAALELGHVRRRAGELEAAVAIYEQLIADPSVDARYREHAAWWLARLQQDRGQNADARRTWERLAGAAEDLLLRVRAFDAWISSLVEAGRLEEAAGVLDLCRAGLRAIAEEETSFGAEVREALERMTSPVILARAIEERARASAAPPESVRLAPWRRPLPDGADAPLPRPPLD